MSPLSVTSGRNVKFIESNKLVVRLLLALLMSVAFVALQEIVGVSVYINLAALLVFLYAFYCILTFDTTFFVLCWLMIFSCAGMIVSCMMIEAGGYMVEIREAGYPTGATPRLIFYMLVLITFSYFLFSVFAYRVFSGFFSVETEYQNRTGFYVFIYIFIGAVILYLLAVVAIYGSPHFLRVSRVFFWTYIAPGPTRYIVSLLPQLSFFNGLVYIQTRNPKVRRLALAVFILTLLTVFLQGEKFTGLSFVTYFFVLPIVCVKFKNENFKMGLRSMLIILGVVGLALSIIFFSYYLAFDGDLSLGLYMIADRFVLQGQVWWATDKLVLDDGFKIKGLSYFIGQVMGFGVEDYDVGLKYLMFLICPPSLATNYYLGGSGLTCGFPAVLVYGTGYFYAVPFIILSGLILGFALCLLFYFIWIKDMLPAVFPLKLLYASIQIFIMGDIQLMFSIKYLIFIGGSLFFCFFDLGFGNRKKLALEGTIPAR